MVGLLQAPQSRQCDMCITPAASVCTSRDRHAVVCNVPGMTIASALYDVGSPGSTGAASHRWKARVSPDSLWCTKHADSLHRELIERGLLLPCVSALPEHRRVQAAQHLPPDQLGWATRDDSWLIRREAARRMPPDKLEWVASDPDPDVRQEAARRAPVGHLWWAVDDPDWAVRLTATRRMPPRVARVGRAGSGPAGALGGAG